MNGKTPYLDLMYGLIYEDLILWFLLSHLRSGVHIIRRPPIFRSTLVVFRAQISQREVYECRSF